MSLGSQALMQHIWTKTRSQGLGRFLHDGLTIVKFTQSQIDPYLYYHSRLVFVVYIDDFFMLSPTDDIIDQAIKDLKSTEPWFKMEDQGTVNDSLAFKSNKL